MVKETALYDTLGVKTDASQVRVLFRYTWSFRENIVVTHGRAFFAFSGEAYMQKCWKLGWDFRLIPFSIFNEGFDEKAKKGPSTIIIFFSQSEV